MGKKDKAEKVREGEKKEGKEEVVIEDEGKEEKTENRPFKSKAATGKKVKQKLSPQKRYISMGIAKFC